MNNMLSLEEVKNFLEADQAEVERYIREEKLHAYKIGGAYIRFRKEEVLTLRSELPKTKQKLPPKRSFGNVLFDFWKFNNFYLISLIVVAALAYLLVKN